MTSLTPHSDGSSILMRYSIGSFCCEEIISLSSPLRKRFPRAHISNFNKNLLTFAYKVGFKAEGTFVPPYLHIRFRFKIRIVILKAMQRKLKREFFPISRKKLGKKPLMFLIPEIKIPDPQEKNLRF